MRGASVGDERPRPPRIGFRHGGCATSPAMTGSASRSAKRSGTSSPSAATRSSPSGPLVPQNDPTLMFANAGMVQFKDVFTGQEQRAVQARDHVSQKCIRISGKHNDLENVGVTARHHTFFEMLGNFSLRRLLQGGRDRLRLGVPHQGARAAARTAWSSPCSAARAALPADDEARDIWTKVTGFGDDRIIGLGAKDNFWPMGDTGPCGPCTEIHYFIGDGDAGPRDASARSPTPTARGWVEIWNLVFMQFERQRGRHARRRCRRRRSTPAWASSASTCVLQGVTSATTTPICCGRSSSRRREIARQDVRRARWRPTTCRCASSPTTRARRRS